METAIFRIHGMTSSDCVLSVGGALKEIVGVADVCVSLEEGQVTVCYDKRAATTAQLEAAVRKAGYEVDATLQEELYHVR